MSRAIPQTDPKAGFISHESEIQEAIQRVLSSGWYILGTEVESFEQEFAAFVGSSLGVGVANGTEALGIALRACGVGHGDAVFTVSHTAVATVAAIEEIGAVPVLVDICPDTYTMDPECLATLLNCTHPGYPPPKAVVPVHLYGHPADMPAILDIARSHGLRVVEDCAQAHGARIADRPVGSWGDAAAFSFYPTKNLGALGDGGIVVTSDTDIADRARLLRQYGWKTRYVSATPGMNSRLDELQAAILRAKLPYLAGENARRRTLAQRLSAILEDTRAVLPFVRPDVMHVFHQYVLKVPDRDGIRSQLAEEGIRSSIHYPMPVHKQPAYAGRLLATDMNVTESVAAEVLSLPMYPELSDEDVDFVGKSVREALCSSSN